MIRRSLSLLPSLLLFLSACSSRQLQIEECPRLSCINFVDREGMMESIRTPERLQQYDQVDFLKPQPYQKILRIYGRDAQGNVSSVSTVYHPNGQPKQYLEAVNNQAFGWYREWYANGTLKVEAQIIGGTGDINTAAEKTWLFDGPALAWDENGCLLAEIQYSKGDQDGLALYYHSNGKIWKSIPYANNRIEGTFCIFLENGLLLQKTEYRAGIKCGDSIRYWNENIISSNEQFVQGRLVRGCYYDFNGNLVAQIENGTGFRALFGKDSISELQEYKNGFLDGEVKTFTKNGQLVRLYHMKGNVKQGEEVLYYPKLDAKSTLQPKMSVMWYQGKIQGHTRTWYENGIMESQREMSENKRNGLSTAWYRNGQLMLIEEYEAGKIKRGDYYRPGEKQPISSITDGKGVAALFDAEGNFIRKINYFNGKPEK